MELIYCSVCALTFSSDNVRSVHKHLSRSGHLKKMTAHRINDIQDTIYNIDGYSVTVTLLPYFVNDEFLKNYFPHKNEIKSIEFANNSAKITFNQNSCVEFLLQATSEYSWNGKKYIWSITPVIHGKYIDNYVKKLKKIKSTNLPLKFPTVSRTNTRSNKIQKIDKHKLQKISGSTFTKQINNLLRMIQPNENLLFTRINMIRYDIAEMIKSTYEIEYTNIIVFGSSVNGLATVNSHIDLSLEINEQNIKPLIHKIVGLLDENSQIIDRINLNTQGNISIIHFYHMPTKLNVDLSFNNNTGRENSNIIKFCTSLDSRIKNLYVIIKYWGKKLNLTGSNGKVSNYFIFMLVVFYLQQSEINLLPNFTVIKDLYTKWSYNPRFVETTKNCNINMFDLMLGFFEYYSKFKFSSNVICPNNSTAVRRRQFNTNDLELKEKLESNPACILDPLQVDTFILCDWSKKKLKLFTTTCEEAVVKIQQSKSPVNDKILHFRKFFVRKTYNSLQHSKQSKNIKDDDVVME